MDNASSALTGSNAINKGTGGWSPLSGLIVGGVPLGIGGLGGVAGAGLAQSLAGSKPSQPKPKDDDTMPPSQLLDAYKAIQTMPGGALQGGLPGALSGGGPGALGAMSKGVADASAGAGAGAAGAAGAGGAAGGAGGAAAALGKASPYVAAALALNSMLTKPGAKFGGGGGGGGFTA